MSGSEAWISGIISALHLTPDSYLKLLLDPIGITRGEIESYLKAGGWFCQDAPTPFELRYAYEKTFRQSVDRESRLLIRIKFTPERIPYNIAQEFDLVDLSPSTLFPTLSPELLSGLPLGWYVKLFEHLQAHLNSERLSAQSTARLILSICLGIEIPVTPDNVHLLHLVIALVRQQEQVPPALVSALIPKPMFMEMASILTHLSRSKEFLHSVWDGYTNTLVAPIQIAETKQSVEILEWTGLVENDLLVQNELTQLCKSGELPLIQISPNHAPLPTWLKPNIHYQIDNIGYLADELERLRQVIPDVNADLKAWGDYAQQWAKWRHQYLRNWSQTQEIRDSYLQAHRLLLAEFYTWLKEAFSRYIRYPYLPNPSCVHQVLPYLASQYHPTVSKPMAVVVMDGMAWEDWLTLSSILDFQKEGIHCDTHSILAFLPTLTPISRQALLSGKIPVQFPNQWQTTNHEKAQWVSFWEYQGLQQDKIVYVRGLGKPRTGDLKAEILPIIAQPILAVAAIIVNGIDDLLHANILRDSTLQGEILAWAIQTGFSDFINKLLERFSTVIVTSDHGHITGKGVGNLPLEHLTIEGSLRVSLFQPPLDIHTIQQLPACLIWPGYGLPANLMTIFPETDGIFAPSCEEHVTHGGPSLEEIVIPLVIITAEE